MSPASPLPPRRVPPRALFLSLVALALPLVVTLCAPGTATHYEMLLWMIALVPSFFFAYYRGWCGVALALVAGMLVLALAQGALWALDRTMLGGPLLLMVIANYVGVALGIGWVSELLHRERAVIEQLALTDELTDLPNRRYARMALETEFAAAQRGRELVVVLFDIDYFKEYNDRYGHVAGDEALRVFGQVLQATTRRMNLSARHGGEEFLSVLSDCDLEGGLVFVDRVRTHLGNSQPPAGPLQVSAGVAAYHPGMASPPDLLAAADRALYQAKQGGRNCVRVFEGDLLAEP
jgi:diguanylate cyclase (GGDEF)-like protein